MTAYLTIEMANQRISHAWKTTIQETIEGDEKRSALYTWPRVRLESEMLVFEDEERRFIHAHLWRDLHNLWGIPIISDETSLTAEAAAAQAVLTVGATDYRHFYDGRQCILISDWESYEVATITTVDSGTQITLSGNLSATWPAGTKVFPLYICRVKPEQSRSSKYFKLNEFSIVAEESFETVRTFSYTVPTVDAAVYPVYNSLNLFLTKPKNPITEGYRHPYTLLGELGLNTSFSTYDDTRIIFDRDFLITSKKSVYDLLDFFDAKQGRLKTFYMPTWMEDIIISVGFGSADVTITTKELYLTSDEIVGRHVYIRLPDGSYVCREITARPSSTSITLSSAIGTTVATASLSSMLCCFLYEVRFNIDEIAFEYFKKQTLAQTTLSFNKI